jgi:hypothetical protein
MGDDQAFGVHAKELINLSAQGCAVFDRHAKLAGNRGFGGGHQVKPGHDGAPACEPAGWQLLQEIGENRGAAGVVEEHDLGRDACVDQQLVYLGGPVGGALAQGGVDPQIGPFAGQAGGGVKLGLRVGGLPIGHCHVVQRVGRDQVADRAKAIDCGLQRSGQSDGRPDKQAVPCKANYRHAGGIMEPSRSGYCRPISQPDFGSERRQHRFLGVWK